jgi:hypothetical protein
MVKVPLEANLTSSGTSTSWGVVNVPDRVQSGSGGTLAMRRFVRPAATGRRDSGRRAAG